MLFYTFPLTCQTKHDGVMICMTILLVKIIGNELLSYGTFLTRSHWQILNFSSNQITSDRYFLFVTNFKCYSTAVIFLYCILLDIDCFRFKFALT